MISSHLAHQVFKYSLLLLGIFAAAGKAHAQLFSSALLLQEGPYEYRTLPLAATAAAFVTQGNTQGGQSFAFAGNQIFGDPNGAPVSVYGRAPSVAAGLNYQSFPVVGNAMALVNELNTRGASGFRFLGDNSFNGVASSLLVKYSSADTYTYQQLPPAANATDFLALINAQGAQGFSFEGNVGFFDGGNFIVSSLFAKNTARNATFAYETRVPASDTAAFVALSNAQGARGFRYRGDIAFGSTVFTVSSLYVKDNARPERFVFEASTPPSSTAAFLTQANAQGARNFSYLGDIAFSTPSFVISSIYVSVRGVIFASGFEP